MEFIDLEAKVNDKEDEFDEIDEDDESLSSLWSPESSEQSQSILAQPGPSSRNDDVYLETVSELFDAFTQPYDEKLAECIAQFGQSVKTQQTCPECEEPSYVYSQGAIGEGGVVKVFGEDEKLTHCEHCGWEQVALDESIPPTKKAKLSKRGDGRFSKKGKEPVKNKRPLKFKEPAQLKTPVPENPEQEVCYSLLKLQYLYFCPSCHAGTNDFQQYVNHMKLHDGKCRFCDMHFLSYRTRSRHEARYHKDSKKFFCIFCKRSYPDKITLDDHTKYYCKKQKIYKRTQKFSCKIGSIGCLSFNSSFLSFRSKDFKSL